MKNTNFNINNDSQLSETQMQEIAKGFLSKEKTNTEVETIKENVCKPTNKKRKNKH